jgi:hypothetical protein
MIIGSFLRTKDNHEYAADATYGTLMGRRHKFVVSAMQAHHPAIEPWYRPGQVAILAALIVAAALFAAQFLFQTATWQSVDGGFCFNSTAREHGWPVACWSRIDTQRIDMNAVWSGIPPSATTRYRWEPAGLLVTGVIVLVMPLSTMFVTECWRRRRWQFGTRALLAVIAVAATAAFLTRIEVVVLGPVGREVSFVSVLVSVPLAVAVGCAIYTLSWLVYVPCEVIWHAARGRDPWA